MHKRSGNLIFIAALLLTACSGKEPEAERKVEHKALYKGVNAPLEKAKGVEQQLEESAEEQKQAIDRQLGQ